MLVRQHELARQTLATADIELYRRARRLQPRHAWRHEAKEKAMLVLSRKKNESIVINNDITIVVVEIRGDKVRLGVEAPKEVPVHRREVYDAIQRNNGTTPAEEENPQNG